MIQKLAVVIVVLTFINCSVDAGFSQAQIKEVAQRCNATDADLEVALKYEVPSTPTGKCLMNCMLKAVGTLNVEGIYNRTNALEALKVNWPEVDVKVLEQLADQCQGVVGGIESVAKTDPCEYGHTVATCVNKSFKDTPKSCPTPEDHRYVPSHLPMYAMMKRI